MTFLMSELKSRNLFFLDSMTNAKSTAFSIAKEFGLKAAKRDVFLDNDSDRPAKIRKQFDELTRMAKLNGRPSASATAPGDDRRAEKVARQDRRRGHRDRSGVGVGEMTANRRGWEVGKRRDLSHSILPSHLLTSYLHGYSF